MSEEGGASSLSVAPSEQFPARSHFCLHALLLPMAAAPPGAIPCPPCAYQTPPPLLSLATDRGSHHFEYSFPVSSKYLTYAPHPMTMDLYGI